MIKQMVVELECFKTVEEANPWAIKQDLPHETMCLLDDEPYDLYTAEPSSSLFNPYDCALQDDKNCIKPLSLYKPISTNQIQNARMTDR